jgi:hypothetical protein
MGVGIDDQVVHSWKNDVRMIRSEKSARFRESGSGAGGLSAPDMGTLRLAAAPRHTSVAPRLIGDPDRRREHRRTLRHCAWYFRAWLSISVMIRRNPREDAVTPTVTPAVRRRSGRRP